MLTLRLPVNTLIQISKKHPSQTSYYATCSRLRQYTKPAFAPKATLDVKHIRQNPGLYEQNCVDRNYAAHKQSSWRILELHTDWLKLQQDARGLRECNNRIKTQLAETGSRVQNAEPDKATPIKHELITEAKSIKLQLTKIEAREEEMQEEIERLALELPNLSSTFTPTGNDAEVVGYINAELKPSNRIHSHKSHVEIGQDLGILDLKGSAQTSGWGWYFLIGDGALLEQALIQYALSVARGKGWKAVAPPSMVYSHIATACGFQPRDHNGEQQIYAIEQTQKDKAKPQLVLAGTAEIPLAGMKADQTLEMSDLPLKMVGVNRCYRAEAGARGADTRGLYRVHEFTKVEMFAWTEPDADEEAGFAEPVASPSDIIFNEMQWIQTEILSGLGLYGRILEMPTTELGASATRKQDIEVFFPSRQAIDNGWGEVTSMSMCTDYQTRRLQTRLRTNAGKLRYPCTLNGTALAVPRVLAAMLETHWNEADRSVSIPEVLQGFMGGQGKIHVQK